MKVNPKALTNRNELNLKQGIKSSLPKMKVLFASIYTLYKISPSSKLVYTSEKLVGGKTEINLISTLEPSLQTFFTTQLTSSGITSAQLLDFLNKSPLFTAQLEALQVAIQLFWKLGEVHFDQNMADSTERTGGNRFDKTISFSTNLDLIDSILTDDLGALKTDSLNLIFNYLTDSTLPTGNIETKLVKTLTVFSEEAQFKIRDTSSNEIFFQQEGIYSELKQGNTVVSNDFKEPVGPFRVLKSAISDNLNLFFEDSRANGFQLKAGISSVEVENYLIRVNTSLDLNPSKTNISIYKEDYISKSDLSKIEQKIYFGAPGTGKSYKVNQTTKGLNEKYWERITFHPEFDYASFIGSYKPEMDDKEIIYEFVPQAFTNIYVKAWNSIQKGEDLNYFLIIEEINRGNCAEIFGDIFQLLDRNSDYDITPTKELKQYLKKPGVLNDIDFGLKEGKLKLPSNLNILATMNTSDQSLFPMDSAFKRRWDWEYIPINYDETYIDDKGSPKDNKSFKYQIVDSEGNEKFGWINFIKTVNEIIKHNENLGMDKCIGNFFVKPDGDKTISLDVFINKVIFYLWNDVFKDEEDSKNIFPKGLFYEDFFPIKKAGLLKVEEVIKRINKIAIDEKYEEIIWKV